RDIIRFSYNPLRLFGELTFKEDTEVNDLGWEIYPEGLYRVCKKVYETYPFPIYITENGISDLKDEQRGKFIFDDIHVIKQLIAEEALVAVVFHWSINNQIGV